MSTIHASAVLVGARALLIRGPSGCGKSRLAWDLIEAAASGRLAFARLVADDRCHLELAHGRIVVRPADTLAGLIEIRGLGIRRLPFEPTAVVGSVADLGQGGERMPDAEAAMVTIDGVTLPRFAFPSCVDLLAVLLAALRTQAAPGELKSARESCGAALP